jgi:uncharacterized protein (DUF1330 family)|tara:strand:+ start:1920 stop:2708 length:789 start_codon:yes stop_codon:yes gene_type:complete
MKIILRWLVSSFLVLSSVTNAQDSSAPTGLAFLAQSDWEGAVTVIDLVKFTPGGNESYDEYDRLAEEKLNSLGGEIIFRGYSTPFAGQASEREAALIGGDASVLGWDRVTLRKYPSAQAVVDMGASSEYQAAFPHRVQGVEKSLVYAFAANAMPKVPLADSRDGVYMLNLLRFNDDGGVAGYRDYGTHVSPMIQQANGAAVLNMNGLTPVISEQEIDRAILVYYPSPEVFLSMVESAEYLAIAHKRIGSIELGLNFPFSDHR